MVRQGQYQIRAEPVLPEELRPETTLLSKWYQPASEPVRVSRAVAFAAALVASGAVFVGEPSDTPPVETITLDKWYQPASEPNPKWKPAYTWVYSAELKIILRPHVSSWFAQASEPIRFKPRAVYTGQSVLDPLPIPDVVAYDPAGLQWVVQEPEPVRSVLRTPGLGDFATDAQSLTQPETTLLSKWYQPTSEPVRIKSRAVDVGWSVTDPAALTQPETTLVSKWYQPSSEPVWQNPRPVDTGWFTHDMPEEGRRAPDLEWFQQASEPVRSKPPLRLSGWFVIDVQALTQPETPGLDKWFVAASEPIRAKPPITPSVDFAGDPKPPAADFDPQTLEWWKQPSEPVRIKSRAVDVGWSVTDPAALTQPETTLVSKWFVAASEPVRAKQQPTPVAYHISDPKPVAAVFDPQTLEWYRQTSEPVRVKPKAIEVSWTETDSQALTQPETPLVSKWYQPPSEPVREKPRAVDIGWFAHDMPEEGRRAPALDWYQPASEPVRVKPPLRASEWFVVDPQALIQLETTLVSKWFVQASEPVRSKKQPTPVEYHVDDPKPSAAAFDPQNFDFRQVSEPVRPKPYTWVYSAEIRTVLRPLMSSWFVQASEPVRSKKQPTPVAYHVDDPKPSVAAFDPQNFDFRQVSEPVRPKPYTWSFSAQGKPVLRPLISSWFVQAPEPVRVKARVVNVGLFVTNPVTPAVTPFDPQGLE